MAHPEGQNLDYSHQDCTGEIYIDICRCLQLRSRREMSSETMKEQKVISVIYFRKTASPIRKPLQKLIAHYFINTGYKNMVDLC